MAWPNVFAFLFGLSIGSFLNVLIARLPEKQSLLGRSGCPHCRKRIRWYDLFPIASFVLLAGRCRDCRRIISVRYPFVEGVTGLLAIAICQHFGWTPLAAVYFVFACALIVVTFIDYDHHIIPDVITLPGVVLGIVAHGLLSGAWWPSLIGAVGGAFGLWLVAFTYLLVAKREGLGFGDVKLAAMLGAFLGGSGVFLTVFLAAMLGSLAGITLIALGRGTRLTHLPFGSFLAPVGLVVLFYGPAIVEWYVMRLRGGG
jgi:leader peptidase (prepilin peptidase)/N-methyltransferase